MSEFIGMVAKSVKDEVAKEIGKKIVFGALVLMGIAGTALWAYLKGLPAHEAAMYFCIGFPVSLACTLLSLILLRNLLSKRASLVIEYDPRKHYAVDCNGLAVTHFLIRNTSGRHSATNLVVLIDSLVDITSESAHPQASWFINVPITLERADRVADGVTLKPLRTVEAFGPKAPKNSDLFFFPSSDPRAGELGAFFSGTTRYRMTVCAVADNADPKYEHLIIFERNGVMQMLMESDPEARREMLRPAPKQKEIPPSPIDVFVGRWRMTPEKGEPAFVLSLDKSMRATKSHVPDATGTWEVVGNEARVTWSDKWRDRLRVDNDEMFKLAFRPGAPWNDVPSNTQRAAREN